MSKVLGFLRKNADSCGEAGKSFCIKKELLVPVVSEAEYERVLHDFGEKVLGIKDDGIEKNFSKRVHCWYGERLIGLYEFVRGRSGKGGKP